MTTIEKAAIEKLLAINSRLYDSLVEILPLAEAYLKAAPTHPDHAKLEDARAAIASAEAP